MNIRFGGVGIEGDIAHLVDDEQRDPLQAVELGVQAAVALGVGQLSDPFVGDPPREREFAVLVDHRDMRTASMQVDADTLHR
jgi:hypothetical protein